MIRDRTITRLRTLAISLGSTVEGSEWHIFGSVDRNEPNAEDIDLMIFCENDNQADFLREAIDPNSLDLPIHLSLMAFEEAVESNTAHVQSSSIFFP